MHALVPRLKVGEVGEVLPLVLVGPHPRIARHVGDRIVAGKIGPVLEARVHDAVEPVNLVGVAIDGVGDLLLRIVAEVVRLAAVGAEVRHLPEEPLLNFQARALLRWVELARLAPKILQDGARLEDGDRLTVWTVEVDDGGHPIVWRNGQKFGLELVAFTDVDGLDRVGDARLLAHDGDLVPVGRGPVVELDGRLGHGGCSSRTWAGDDLSPGTMAAQHAAMQMALLATPACQGSHGLGWGWLAARRKAQAANQARTRPMTRPLTRPQTQAPDPGPRPRPQTADKAPDKAHDERCRTHGPPSQRCSRQQHDRARCLARF